MRILVVDDHGIVRQGLRSLLEHELDWEVIGEAQDGRLAIELAKELSPDVIIMDITMPNMNGIEATRQIIEYDPQAKIVVLSVHTESNIVRGILQAGALGYVLKTYLFEDLEKAIEAASKGKHYLNPTVAGVVVKEYINNIPGELAKEDSKLTHREKQVVQLIAEGKTTKQIARMLHVSPKTIDANRRAAMNKLYIGSIAELTKFAIREGLTSIEI